MEKGAEEAANARLCHVNVHHRLQPPSECLHLAILSFRTAEKAAAEQAADVAFMAASSLVHAHSSKQKISTPFSIAGMNMNV